jgi:hypothetical protein
MRSLYLAGAVLGTALPLFLYLRAGRLQQEPV